MLTPTKTKITYIPIDSQNCEFRAQGRDFDNHADAYIAALTDGEGLLDRDSDGRMRATVNGKVIYSGGSFVNNDQEAKNEVVREIARDLRLSEYRYTTLKVERDGEGNIIKIDDVDRPDLIAYWNPRLGEASRTSAE